MFQFGNPNKRSDKVSKKRRRRSNPKSKAAKRVKRNPKGSTKRRGKKKNPIKMTLKAKDKKTRKVVAKKTQSWTPLRSEITRVRSTVQALKERAGRTKNKVEKYKLKLLAKSLQAALDKMTKDRKLNMSEKRQMARDIRAAGYIFSVEKEYKKLGKGGKVARKKKTRRKKRKKKTSKRKTTSKRRKSSKKKSAPKRRKTSKRRTSKKRASKRRTSKRRASKRRTSKRRIKRSASVTGRKARRGTAKYSGPIPKKKGKTRSKNTRRGKYTVSVKKNPIFGASLDAKVARQVGVGLNELSIYALAGAGTTSVEKAIAMGLAYIPGVEKVLQPLGASATGVVNLAVATAVHKFINPRLPAGKARQVMEGLTKAFATLAAANIGKAAVQMIPGMSGVIYTPDALQGINYTPDKMSGINYTPDKMGVYPKVTPRVMSGAVPQMGSHRAVPQMGSAVPQMGYGPDFGQADYGGGGGYTQEHKFSRADFGEANYGDEEPVLDQTMN